MTETLTIEIGESAASELRQTAEALHMSVSELVEVMAEQLSDGGSGFYDLTDAQMEQIRRNVEDPAPLISQDAVEAEIDRALAAKK